MPLSPPAVNSAIEGGAAAVDRTKAWIWRNVEKRTILLATPVFLFLGYFWVDVCGAQGSSREGDKGEIKRPGPTDNRPQSRRSRRSLSNSPQKSSVSTSDASADTLQIDADDAMASTVPRLMRFRDNGITPDGNPMRP